MARTIVGVNDPKAVKKYSGLLAMDTSNKSYWNSRMMGRGESAEVPVQILTDLETDAGEQITYDLLAELTMAPVEGEDTLEGKEERQRFYTDSIYVDQARVGTNTGGRMTRKRTLHNLRDKARRQQSSYWSRLFDELLFIYISGARGVNDSTVGLLTSYAGRANNALVAPDSDHTLFGSTDGTLANVASNRAALTSSHKMELHAIDRAYVRAAVQGGGDSGIPVMQPCKIDGKEVYVCVMHIWQEDDLRSNTGTGQWLDIQKAAAGAAGMSSPLFKDSLGMYRNTILHSHKSVRRFSYFGSGAVAGARALYMGAQAGVVAFGSPGTNLRFDWFEETRDNGDKVVISTNSIFGTKKTNFTTERGSQDAGVMSIDTACASR